MRRPRRPQPGQHDPLQAQLPVLDLGDVLELGRQAGDPAQRLAVSQVELLAVALVVLLLALVERGAGPGQDAVDRPRCGRPLSRRSL